CHTREMNHGDRFWHLLNELTDGKALDLRQELKRHKTAISD
ncbi:MAG: YgjP-like metallopeptidase domain-containing protein, partial [Bacteroides sp.]